ncbi:MAG TPA: radical SAM protein [Candidatus Acidoferrum sp.]|nr:radical SAM protein [Candidatus Acidoferrum sp.]
MRFPALLTAKIAKARIERILRPTPHGQLLRFGDPAEVLHSGSDHPVSHERIREVIASPAPVIWIGGSEPLDHPGIAHFVRAIASSGHYIFLETNGTLLRRRIHEFQPSPRVFLTVRLDASRTPQFDRAVEGLRAARLSGFFTAVHSLVDENSELSEVDRLRELFLELDVDGWMITTGSTDEGAASKTGEARKLIPSTLWRKFSEQIESELFLHAKGKETHPFAPARKPDAESCEEDVKVA